MKIMAHQQIFIWYLLWLLISNIIEKTFKYWDQSLSLSVGMKIKTHCRAECFIIYFGEYLCELLLFILL